MMLSQVKHIFFSELNWRVLNFLGTWQQSQSILIPVSGICYWLTPPTWSKLFKDPLQVSVYICYILLTSAIFSHLSVNKNDYEDNPESVIEDLLGPTDLTMAGKFEDSDEALRQEIRRVIPIATVLGGLMWGLIWILSDILEVTGGGQGMLLIAETIYRIYEAWVAEKKTLVAMR
jgi:preprotein translocase subunit SecY